MSEPPAYFSPPPRQRAYGAPYDDPPIAPAGQPTTLPLAAPGWRLLARVIDTVLVTLIGAPLTLPLLSRYLHHVLDIANAAAATHTTPDVYDGTTGRLLTSIALISLAVSFLYEVPQLARWGQTVGKRLCRVRVVHKAGRPAPGLGLATAALRWLVSGAAPAVPGIGPIIAVLDDLWLLWDRPWRQCLHDKAAATVVVRLPG